MSILIPHQPNTHNPLQHTHELRWINDHPNKQGRRWTRFHQAGSPLPISTSPWVSNNLKCESIYLLSLVEIHQIMSGVNTPNQPRTCFRAGELAINSFKRHREINTRNYQPKKPSPELYKAKNNRHQQRKGKNQKHVLNCHLPTHTWFGVSSSWINSKKSNHLQFDN